MKLKTLGVILQAKDSDPFSVIGNFLNSPLLKFALQMVGVFVIILWLSLVYWTYSDAGRRGALKVYWGIVALLFPFLGTLIYLIVRPPEYLLDSRERELELAILERELRQQVQVCTNCRAVVEKDYLLCPECGRQLKKPCVSCSKPLNLRWDTCPYCGTGQSGTQKRARY